MSRHFKFLTRCVWENGLFIRCNATQIPKSICPEQKMKWTCCLHFWNCFTLKWWQKFLPETLFNFYQTTWLLTFLISWRKSPKWARAPSFTRFLDHTQRRNTVGRTPLDEWSARRRDLYQTTHNTPNRETSMPPLGFEPTIAAGERPHTYALDRADTWIGTGLHISKTVLHRSIV